MEEDKEVLLPRGEEYIFGEEAILENDIKILEDETNALGLFFKCKGTEVYKRALENLLTRYKQQKTELESVKEIYYTQTEMDNVMERYRKLVEENKILKKGIVPSYENTIKELEEQLFDSIPKSKIKEKIEARESSIADIKDNFVINEGMMIEINRLETEIDVLQELLKEK